MNAIRRKALQKAHDQLEEIYATIDELWEEEQSAADNVPESLQDSERCEIMHENCGDLESVSINLSDVIETLENILER